MKKRIVRIGNREVGPGKPVYVIAEAGSNHDGSLKRALELVEAAANIGADAIKFQSFTPQGLVSPGIQPQVFDILDRVKMPGEWVPKLAAHARKFKIHFLSTPFDEEQVDLLDKAGVPAFKVASGDITHIPLLRYIARKKKPVILSTGASNLSDVARAVDAVFSAGNRNLILLHCVVRYPSEIEDSNLAVLDTLSASFPCPVGFSDHSLGDLASVLAAAFGASVIEKHFTFNRSFEGPDHPFAMEIDEFESLIRKIRLVPAAIGSGEKRVLPVERGELYEARRGIYAAVDIKAGDKITREKLKILRPRKGIAPEFIDIVTGSVAARNIKAHEPVEWKHILK